MSLEKQQIQKEGQFQTSSQEDVESLMKENIKKNEIDTENVDRAYQQSEREKADKTRIEQIKSELQGKTEDNGTQENIDSRQQEILKNIEQKIALINFDKNKDTKEELIKKKELADEVTKELINNDDSNFTRAVKNLIKEKIAGNITIDKIIDQKHQQEIKNDILPIDFQNEILKDIVKNHLDKALMDNISASQLEEMFFLSSNMFHGWDILDKDEKIAGKYIKDWIISKYPEGMVSKLKHFISKENPKAEEATDKKIAFLEGMFLKEILVTHDENAAFLLKGKELKTLTEPFKEKTFQFHGKKFNDRIPQIIVAISKLRGESEDNRSKTLSFYGSIVRKFTEKMEEDSGAKKGITNQKYINVLKRVGRIKKDLKIFG